jgi:hypothetical protein
VTFELRFRLRHRTALLQSVLEAVLGQRRSGSERDRNLAECLQRLVIGPHDRGALSGAEAQAIAKLLRER